MISINYPKQYETEESRIGKKFKYYKVEPYSIENEKKEIPPKISIGQSYRGRLPVLDHWSKHPEQGNINYMIRESSIFESSYSDIIDEYLVEKENAN